MKVIYIDTETTGLSPVVNGMIEIAALVEINGEVVDSILLEMNPNTYMKPIHIDPTALEVNGRTTDEFANMPSASEQFKVFLAFLNKWVDRFDKQDKFKVCGYNTQFDMGFIEAWFQDNGNAFYGAYFFRKDLDVFALVRHLTHFGAIVTEDEKLGTICEFFGIKHDKAHTAMADIVATRELYLALRRIVWAY